MGAGSSNPCEAVVRELGIHNLCAQSAKPIRPGVQNEIADEGHVSCIVSNVFRILYQLTRRIHFKKGAYTDTMPRSLVMWVGGAANQCLQTFMMNSSEKWFSHKCHTHCTSL